MEEIIRSDEGEKAPGPDGFNMISYKHYWTVVKGNIMAVVDFLYQSGNIERNFNASFIALMPKKAGVEEIKDFRPISQVGSFYKVISKLLAERLKKVMNVMVADSPMAFIKGRQTTDAVSIANECFDSMQAGH